MYGRTSFRGAKTYKIGKKGVFLIILTNLEKDMMKNWEKRMQKRVFRVYFHTWKIWVCFKSPFTRMISSLKYKWPPPGADRHYLDTHMIQSVQCAAAYPTVIGHWTLDWSCTQYDLLCRLRLLSECVRLVSAQLRGFSPYVRTYTFA